jgi:hypothetical protein
VKNIARSQDTKEYPMRLSVSKTEDKEALYKCVPKADASKVMAVKEMRTEPIRNHLCVRFLEKVVRRVFTFLAALAGCYARKSRESIRHKRIGGSGQLSDAM